MAAGWIDLQKEEYIGIEACPDGQFIYCIDEMHMYSHMKPPEEIYSI